MTTYENHKNQIPAPQTTTLPTNPQGQTSREDKIILTGIGLVFILAAAHNFTALQDFAYQAGVAYLLSFTTPILFDTFIALAVWVTLRNRRLDESARIGWAIVYTFTVVSIILNAMHYPFTPAGMAMALIVPSVIFCSAELGKGLVESARKRQSAVQSLAELSGIADKARADLDRIERQKQQAAAELEAIRTELKAGKLQQNAASIAEMNAAKAAKIEARRGQVLDLLGQKLSNEEIAQALNVSVRTVRNDVRQLNGAAVSARGVTL